MYHYSPDLTTDSTMLRDCNLCATNTTHEMSLVILETISDELMETIEYVFGCFLIVIFAILGVIGTSINIMVLSKCNITKDSSNILLLSLSVADFLFCLTIPIWRSKCILSQFLDILTVLKIDMAIYEYFSEFTRVFYSCSITMVGVITVQRFLAVFFPFRTASLMTPFRMKLVCLFVYVINLFLFSPTFFSFTHTFVFSPKYNGSIPVLIFTDFFKNNYDAIGIEIAIVYNIVIRGSSMLITLVFTPAIAVKIWMATNNRAKLTNRKYQNETQAAKVLLTVCTVSLIFYGPYISYEATIYFLPSYFALTNSFQLYLRVTDFSGTLSASVNFIIYVTMSGKFRRKYKELIANFFCLKKTKKKTFVA